MSTSTLSKKNDTDVAHYNFNAHQPILVIFDRCCWKNMLANGDFDILPLLTNVSALPGETWTP